MGEIISMYIDDEMTLDEKIAFIEKIRADDFFSNEAMDLLRQEKRLRSEVVERLPVFDPVPRFDWKKFFRPFFQPMGIAASTLATIVIFLLIYTPQPTPGPLAKRFVIFRPDVSQVEITGTFTEWKRISMNKIGDSGYWEIFLNLAEGEHRFAYILENQYSFADPTIPARELDGFGGENSIFYVTKKI